MKQFAIKKILVPVDFSYSSLKAINPAVLLAKLTKAEITLVHVIDVLPSTAPAFYFSTAGSPAYENDLTDASNRQLNKLALTMKKKGVEKVNLLSVRGRTHKEIIRSGKKIKADLIVMGTHGASGFSDFFMGSNTYRVVSHAECPVLSVQKHIRIYDFKNILVPFRDKAHSREKVMYAIEMARIYGAALQVLGLDTLGGKAHVKKMTREAEQIKKIVEGFGVKCKIKVVTASYMGDTVLKYAKQINADLIMAGADMDKVSISEYVIGPFIQQIVNHSPIPVLSIRTLFNTDTIDLRFY
ncbi:MAG: universal stress protein [Bacteroidia bacterium]|nr:universal stress protein [Bacteroidia bacterium]